MLDEDLNWDEQFKIEANLLKDFSFATFYFKP